MSAALSGSCPGSSDCAWTFKRGVGDASLAGAVVSLRPRLGCRPLGALLDFVGGVENTPTNNRTDPTIPPINNTSALVRSCLGSGATTGFPSRLKLQMTL